MKNTVKLCFVGDIMLGNSSLMLSRGVYSKCEKKGFDFLYSQAKPFFSEADLVFGNLECSISKNKEINIFKPYIADRSVIKSLRISGFNVLNVANNHTMQYGSQVFFR